MRATSERAICVRVRRSARCIAYFSFLASFYLDFVFSSSSFLWYRDSPVGEIQNYQLENSRFAKRARLAERKPANQSSCVRSLAQHPSRLRLAAGTHIVTRLACSNIHVDVHTHTRTQRSLILNSLSRRVHEPILDFPAISSLAEILNQSKRGVRQARTVGKVEEGKTIAAYTARRRWSCADKLNNVPSSGLRNESIIRKPNYVPPLESR